ncbi:hypothetical protein ACWCL1_06645 [Ligilactobacillus sp. LYQ135]
MVNRKQLKLSIILGSIILIIQIGLSLFSKAGMHQTFAPIYDLFGTALWYVPLIYFGLRLFVICGIIYLIFRVINYILNLLS